MRPQLWWEYKIGTAANNDINDDDSLVQLTSFISVDPIGLNGVLSTSEYLGAKIKLKVGKTQLEQLLLIVGLDLNNKVINRKNTRIKWWSSN